jgi:hypothetical protein
MQTNLYVVQVKNDIELQKVQDAVNNFYVLNDESCTINLYSKYSNDFGGYIIGANEFLYSIWNSQIHDSSLIDSNEPYIWVGSDYWSPFDSLDFPFDKITINDRSYSVAGSCNVSIMYDYDLPDDTNTYDASAKSMIMPIKTYLTDGLPIKGIVLFFKRSPSEKAFQNILDSFQDISKELIVKNPSFVVSGIASPVVIICIIAIIGGVVFIGIDTYMTVRQARAKQRIMLINGATNARLVLDELLIQISISFLGFILAVLPAQAVHFIDKYAYNLTFINRFVIWCIFTCAVVVTQFTSIRQAVRNNRRKQGR